MQKLIDGLRHFQENVFWERRELFEKSAGGQNPQALLITCSDSRVLPETLLQADPGDLFVARNAGNLVPPPAVSGGEAATIDYAVRTLGVTDLIVCGHYRCGAVKALLDGQGEPVDSPVSAWLTHAVGTLTAMETKHSCLTGHARWDKAVEQNVLVQLDNLAKHPAVAEGLSHGKLRLHAWVLRFESSEVYGFDPDHGGFEPLSDMHAVRPALPAQTSRQTADATVAQDTSERQNKRGDVPAWYTALKSDVPASLVVFAVALPLCVAIAKASGVPTAAGIITAIIGGMVVGLLGGGPFQVSGPTAGLIAILLGAQERLGPVSLGVVVFLAGMLQIVAGAFRLGQWFRAVSPAVILGMLAGIGCALLAQQSHATVDDPPMGSALANFLGMPRAVFAVFDGHAGHPGHLPAALIGLLTLSVLLLWKAAVPKRLQGIPAVLAAVVLATATASALNLPIQKVDFDSLASGVKIFEWPSLFLSLTDPTLWRMAITIALLASAESLLTAAALDGLHTGPRTRYDRELTAQGLGNILCGLVGALPLAGVIVRSSANLEAGAKSRWATVLHGVWLLAFVLLAPGLLRLIPVSALAAILVLTGFRLIQFPAIRALWKESPGEGIICVAVAITVVTLDLLSGVILGVALSVAKLVYTFSLLRIEHRTDHLGAHRALVLEGSATFLRLPKLAAALEAIPAGIDVKIDSKGMSYIDHSCLTLLGNWKRQHEATGGRVTLDWETLRSRFQTSQPRPRRNATQLRPGLQRA
jgi:MFS superfamily sulfate permease-like transporter/carbonic anhydrase